MTATRPRPVVTLTLNESIQKLVGDYNLETQDLIWEIADNQKRIAVGCECQKDLDSNVQKFIDNEDEENEITDPYEIAETFFASLEDEG